jgi:ribonuclease HII
MKMSETKKVVGVDECSYGSWIGHVWAAAVMLDPQNPIKGLDDSKKLTPEKRSALSQEIKQKAKAYGIGYATADEIYEVGPLAASHIAMRRAIDQIAEPIDLIIVDGSRKPKWGWETETLVKGDSLVQEIMAASILAKVSRTQEMADLAKIHPDYGFDKHQGYGTKQHQDAIDKYGVLPTHRKKYAPIAAALAKTAVRSTPG